MGTLEYGDAVWHGEAIENAARREGAAFVKAQESAAVRDTAAGQLRGAGLGFDHQRDVLHAAAEARRNAGVGGFHQLVELVRR